MKTFGFANIDITIEDLTKKDQFIQLGYAHVRIDLITELIGLKFSTAYKNKVTGTYGSKSNVNYISADDLISNKTLSGRKQDLFDVYWIKKYRSKKRKK